VIELACFIQPDPPGTPGVDLTPDVITNATLYELDEGFTVLSQQEYIGPFFNGDTIQYTSISEALDPNVPLDDQQSNIPKYIQFLIFGGNEQGEVLVNAFIMRYTLSCEVEPIEIGNKKGWIKISDYAPPIPAFCGAVTYAPTATPSEAPTESPTTADPTVTPSEAPTESPTTAAPTVTPSEAPTESPTTAAPTITSSPSEAPTESSTFNSMSYHSASFSVSHAKTAKSKAVKAKGGKISKRA
jgi:hypothetical protein